VLLAVSLALIVSTFAAEAAPVVAPSGGTPQLVAATDSLDFSARKRYRRGRGNAAGLAMMGMMVGTIGAMIAAQRRHDDDMAAYNRAYAAQYPYGYAQPEAYVVHQPRGYYHQPHVYQQPHIQHFAPHVQHFAPQGHPPAGRVINKAALAHR
jgi:hypothetical protein